MLDEVHKVITTRVPFAEKDRVFSNDIETGIEMVREQVITEIVKKIAAGEGILPDTNFSIRFEMY